MIQDFFSDQGKLTNKEHLLEIEKWMMSNPHYIYADTPVLEAANQLVDQDKDYTIVVTEGMSPIGIITANNVLQYMLQGDKDQPSLLGLANQDFFIVYDHDSILDLLDKNYKYFLVMDAANQLVGVLTRYEILQAVSYYLREVNQMEHTAEVLSIILESAYEGVAVVDEQGVIVEFNNAYSRFIGIDRENAIGKNVQDVIDNTKLHNTVKTGMPERGTIQYIQGQAMVVHRIPLWKGNQVVGAIGMLIFEGLTELYKIYERMQHNYKEDEASAISSMERNRNNDLVSLDQIIGESESTTELKSITRKIAKKNVTTLITGESGTGKEMFAQSIHVLSPFLNGRFVSVNCGAIPEQLFESELFGYEEGAFTGAKKGGKPGKFEMAQNGTLFLDEIGEMPLSMQTKLLRILQEKEFERVGGTRRYKIHTRIIAATNKDLEQMVRDGQFREDLYYRINVIELPIPPLRSRQRDIPSLMSYYLERFCHKHNTVKKSVSSEAMKAVVHYPWYGNIRELMNHIEQLVVLVEENTIELNHLSNRIKDYENVHIEQEISPLFQVKNEEKEHEKEIIISTLEKHEGNKSKTAEELGIHRTTLYQKLKKYGL
ncbi:sigma-54-dependent Fis family transcriptional regulator [Pontibacillus marinus]|uniref:Fis family transcriptional regulator n=1 Tax=Pontibacillus marinus BH030004 = DSM 16465 TaxID=1385511 RepID=A0A0A5GI75_9BACI|nr:sigma-54-dependent Fis family transcriptional regulator [Pontibacillus marinus]KGX91714.1 Fis family transcriptional regulator [Pontibacillus marinus BH030004 = DSM 16465]